MNRHNNNDNYNDYIINVPQIFNLALCSTEAKLFVATQAYNPPSSVVADVIFK